MSTHAARRSVPEINGRLDRHLPSCEWAKAKRSKQVANGGRKERMEALVLRHFVACENAHKASGAQMLNGQWLMPLTGCDTLGNMLDDLEGMLAAREAKLKQAMDFVRDCAENYDCDADAHRYGTMCRACSAKRVLTGHLPFDPEQPVKP